MGKMSHRNILIMNTIDKLKTILTPQDLRRTFSFKRFKNRVRGLQALLKKDPVPESSPRFLHVDVTNKCNLRCIMCGRTAHELEGGEELPFDTFTSVIDQAADMGVELVLLHSSGEPLMNKRIVNMIEYVSSKGLASWMSTNCTLLTPKKSRAIIEAGLSGIVLSLDGATKETYEHIRRGAKFENTVSNIQNFIRLKNELGSSIITTIQLIRMDENKDEIDLFHRMWAPYDGVNVMVKPLALWGEEASKGRADDFACDKLWYWMKVHSDGKIYPCGHDFEKQYCLGDTVKDGLLTSWNGKMFKEFREQMIRDWRSIAMCRQCGYGPPRKRNLFNNAGFCAVDIFTLTKIIFLYGYKKQ